MLRFGVLGAGRIGKVHARTIAASGKATAGAEGAAVSSSRLSVSVPVRPNRLVTLTCGV